MIHSKKSGFTLIELLVVIVIIGVLIAIFFTAGSYVIANQNENQAKLHLDIIKLALEDYKTQEGDYPEVECKEFSELDEVNRGFELLRLLCDADSKEDILTGNSHKILPLESLAFETATDDENVIFLVDPWGSPYIYAYPRPDSKSGYLLISKGSNMLTSDYTSEEYVIVPKVSSDDLGLPQF